MTIIDKTFSKLKLERYFVFIDIIKTKILVDAAFPKQELKEILLSLI